CVLFAVILGGGLGLSGVPQGAVAPAGLGVVLGAFLFGVGMQIGGSCASGTLFSVGSGQTSILYTLGGFIVGSVASAFAATWINASGFSLVRAKILGRLVVDSSHAPYWTTPKNAAALHASVLADRISVMDFGIMIGALIASALAGAFVLHSNVPVRIAVGAVLG